MVPVLNIELSQEEHNICLEIGKLMHEGGILKTATVEALCSRTMEIVVREYATDPAGLISYFKKKSKNQSP